MNPRRLAPLAVALLSLSLSGCVTRIMDFTVISTKNVDIPGVFARYNEARIYGLWKNAKQSYDWLTKQGWAADKCVQCGDCEPKCPQKLDIRKQLTEAHQALTAG